MSKVHVRMGACGFGLGLRSLFLLIVALPMIAIGASRDADAAQWYNGANNNGSTGLFSAPARYGNRYGYTRRGYTRSSRSRYYGYNRYNRTRTRSSRTRSKAKRRFVRQSPALWQPEKAGKGPVQIIISLPDQRMNVYKNGVRVASSRVSTGKPGYSTPAGIFSIVQKHRVHYSNLYGNAPMPYMQRITWSGVALHAGRVPNYPASHGCIRQPSGFAKKMFGLTKMGAHVIVARSKIAPRDITHENLLQPAPLAAQISLGPVTPNGTPIRLASASQGFVPAAITDQAIVEPEETQAPAPAAAPVRSTSPLRILITRSTKTERIKDVQRRLMKFGYELGGADGIPGKQTIAAIKKFQDHVGQKATGRVTDTLVKELYHLAGETEVSTGHLYVRQNFRSVFDAPIAIRDPDAALGTHMFLAMNFADDATEARWTALKVQDRPRRSKKSAKAKSKKDGQDAPVETAATTPEGALDRIVIPAKIGARLSRMLTPGSSIIISDHGSSFETTTLGTDFVVLTR